MPVQRWAVSALPNDLGDDNHRWSWVLETDGGSRNILWGHRCSKAGRYTLCWIDLSSGTRHKLVAEEPLHLEPSILCPVGCGDHGFVRDGRWVAA